MATEYDARFFDVIREGCISSAQVVVPLVLEELGKHPGTVIDVGCGQGWWGQQFNLETGCQVIGYEANAIDPVIPIHAVDLNDRFGGARSRVVGEDAWTGAADLVVCLEVAEHLPPERAETFIEDLCSLAPAVLFSAAIPGQGGHGHLNEQWQSYWARLFAQNGRWVSGSLRSHIWTDSRVEPWYRQNLLLATTTEVTRRDRPWRPMVDMVHPIYWRDRAQLGTWEDE